MSHMQMQVPGTTADYSLFFDIDDLPGSLSSGGLAPWQIRKVAAYIDSNLGTTIRMGEIAAQARLSTSYFSRAFRISFGASPHSYIVQKRIERTQQLMLTTDASLAQIALDCGLSDQPHFSNLFRRHVGMTPNHWRRQRRIPPAPRPEFTYDQSHAA